MLILLIRLSDDSPPNAKPWSHSDAVTFGVIFVALVVIACALNLWWKWSYRRWKERQDLPPTHGSG